MGETSSVLPGKKKGTLSVGRILRFIYDDLQYGDYLATLKGGNPTDLDSRMENVQRLFAKADEFETDYREERQEVSTQEVIDALLEDIALVSEADTRGDGDFVSVMTMHKAKGLEWDTVFIIRCNDHRSGIQASQEDWDFYGGRDARGMNDEEGERRLFYVAMTRAKKKLYISYTSKEFRYGSLKKDLLKLRFIEEIPSGYRDHTGMPNEYRSQPNRRAYSRSFAYGPRNWEDFY